MNPAFNHKDTKNTKRTAGTVSRVLFVVGSYLGTRGGEIA